MLLEFVFESEVDSSQLLGVTIAQDGDRFSRVVIAVVKEENDLTADLLLESSRGLDFREKKSLWKNAARLLAETDDGSGHAGLAGAFRCENSFLQDD